MAAACRVCSSPRSARSGEGVVVKVLPPELLAGVSVERFNREILLAARLQHPHVVPVHAAWRLGGLAAWRLGDSATRRLGDSAAIATSTLSPAKSNQLRAVSGEP